MVKISQIRSLRSCIQNSTSSNMYSKVLPTITIFFVLVITSSNSLNLYRGINGGTNCAGCTILVGLLEQLADVHNETIVKALDRLCSYLPAKIQTPCEVFADFMGPILLELITQDSSPDNACHTLRFCNSNGGPKCQLFHRTKNDYKHLEPKKLKYLKNYSFFLKANPKICELPGIKEICDWLNDIFSKHDPAVDLDSDGFSTEKTLRGTSWRGRDCDDANPLKHPGARSINNDATVDSNCNGIYGTDPKTLKPYEEEYCSNSQSRGLAILGDSVSAHFHLPEEWFDSQKLSIEVFKDVVFILENEIDWPELSSGTGHVNNSWPDIVHGSMDSIYQRLFEQNHCNHGDYQNIAVNGARSSTMASNIMYSLSRNQTLDVPLLVIYALIGNDVCNGHPDTFAHMTTVDDMKKNALQTLRYLDTILPNNSNVMVMGLADGRLLYNNLHNRTHPIGRLRNDVSYPQVYDYLNCLQVSPCTGWMNSNETIRNLTSEHAVLLSGGLQEVVQENTFKNYKALYIDCPLDQAFDEYVKQGGEAWQLIEPVDGFHSNQIGQALTAKVMWSNLMKSNPDFIGPVNPFNDQITKVFGNQSRPL